MSESGLEALWKTVYACNTVVHMLTGHSYAQALRTHLLSSAAVVTLLQTPGRKNSLDYTDLHRLYEALMTKDL